MMGENNNLEADDVHLLGMEEGKSQPSTTGTPEPCQNVLCKRRLWDLWHSSCWDQ